MKTLVVDDIRTFDDLAEYAGTTFTYARTSREGIARLDAEHFDAVWLDYDLGWSNDDRYDDGLRVARWLQLHAGRFRDLKIKIITDQDDMAAKMLCALRESGLLAEITSIGHDWNIRNTR
jgi:CheY-like chemotaxis protein